VKFDDLIESIDALTEEQVEEVVDWQLKGGEWGYTHELQQMYRRRGPTPVAPRPASPPSDVPVALCAQCGQPVFTAQVCGHLHATLAAGPGVAESPYIFVDLTRNPPRSYPHAVTVAVGPGHYDRVVLDGRVVIPIEPPLTVVNSGGYAVITLQQS